MDLAEYLQQQSLALCLVIFIVAGGMIALFGIRMTYLARDLAAATGLGEAFMGAVFIGATTSLSGITASATAAAAGSAGLAVSNSLGGIAAQTLFLVLADTVHRRSNLEFAAASIENLMMCGQLMILLSILLLAFSLPTLDLFGVHPATPLLFVTYVYTLKMLVEAHEKPMWLPRMSQGTVRDSPSPRAAGAGMRAGAALYLQFAFCAAAVALAGWLLAESGMVMVKETALSEGVVGGILVAITTSLPELVVAITAIRMGALTLAVGDIVGGNAFDTLFVAVADLCYRDGPIFADVAVAERVWLACALLMNAILLMGLLYREKRGPGNIGVESWAMLLCYLGTVGYLLRW